MEEKKQIKLQKKKTAQYYALTKPSSFTSVSFTPPLIRQTTTKNISKKRKDSKANLRSDESMTQHDSAANVVST